jgi:hypothetical protein
MAKIFGKVGASVRRYALHYARLRLLILFIVLLVVLDLIIFTPRAGLWTLNSVALLALPLVIFAAVKIIGWYTARAEERYQMKLRQVCRGADRDDKPDALLEALPDDFVVIHNYLCPHGRIDHIVIGPTGVFQIQALAHEGNVVVTDSHILIDDHPPKTDSLQQTLRNHAWIKDYLQQKLACEIPVTAMLVCSRAFKKAVALKGIKVVAAPQLCDLITTAPPVSLPVDAIATILLAAASHAKHPGADSLDPVSLSGPRLSWR